MADNDAVIDYNPDLLTPAQLVDAIEDMGFDASEKLGILKPNDSSTPHLDTHESDTHESMFL